MLSKGKRFTREQFEAFLAQKGLQSAYNTLGTLKYTKGNPCLAVVTSSKHEKRAVLRNKLRRRVYTLSQQYPLSFSGILYASKQSYSFDYETTKRLFVELCTKASK